MDKKAEVGVGKLIVIAIIAIVGAVLLTASAQNLHTSRNTYDVANESTVSTNGTTGIIDTDCRAWQDVVVYNGSDSIILTSGNYTLTNNYVSNGALTTRFNVSTQPIYQGQPWNVSYTCEAPQYDSSSGGRAVQGLIILLFALAITVVVISRSGIAESIRSWGGG